MLIVALCMVFLTGAGGAASAYLPHIRNNPKVILPDRVLRRWAAGYPTAFVIVNLKRPSDFPGRIDWDHPGDRERRRQAVLNNQTRALNRIQSDRLRPTARFEYVNAFAAEVTLQGLEDLLQMDDVESVEEDRVLELHTNQGISLMNASTIRNTYNGQGIAIAIVDTGIDYNHPKLGGGGFPNAKVIGGYDYGGSIDSPAYQDADPMDVHGHGTSCAGIAAGDVGTTGDYIGGVAPGAKLYALKVTYGSGSSAYTSDIVSAWEWCVTHKNDNPSYPIMVISTSLGGDGFSAACDSYSPSMTEAAADAVAAGITLFASSGNNGYCDRISSPACISDIISVGAVFDAGLGTLGFCVDPTSCAPNQGTHASCTPNPVAWSYSTPPDRETPYSNTAGFLDLLAPSHNAYTTAKGGGYTSTFGGTSAACPYAAGAAAILQSAAIALRGAALSPAEVRSILANTGDVVTDVKMSYGKRRINLVNAVNSLTAPAVPAMDRVVFFIAIVVLLALACTRMGIRVKK
ncbi:MAG: Serine protease AprX [Syntrophorhabdus sp. PtaU1.Bin058]|nr:MAG: Serine protease AprX [Syntrophorhabdus sp. PtaU1.Bin058]